MKSTSNNQTNVAEDLLSVEALKDTASKHMRLLPGDSRDENPHKVFGPERFLEVLVCASANNPDSAFHLPISRQDDYAEVPQMGTLLYLIKRSLSVHYRHPQIQYDGIEGVV
jgi:hypothetical protein